MSGHLTAELSYGIKAAKDSTARTVAAMPHWATALRNDAEVWTDMSGISHKPTGPCWDREGVRVAGKDTLIHALFNDGVLCTRCR
jgi:hypothetical protein